MRNTQNWFIAWIIFMVLILFTSNFLVEAIGVFVSCVLVSKLSKRRQISRW